LFRRAGRVLSRLVDLYYSTHRFGSLPRNPRSVAVVRVDNIGDFILWLDGARAIRAGYPQPDYRITLIASFKWSGFAESSGLFDEVIAVDTARFSAESGYRRATCRNLAERRFATAINPTFSRNTWIDDILVKATGAPVRIGHAGDLTNTSRHIMHPVRPLVKRIADGWYTQLISGPEQAKHELERNWRFAKEFDADLAFRVPSLEPAMLSRPPWLPAGSGYFVLFPGADLPARQWQADRFGEIASRIHAKTGWSGIVCGLAGDSATAKRLMAQAKGVSILDACGRTSLQELAGVIAESKLVVTNETSAVHLAAVLGRPTVAILGGGHFGRFLPYPAAAGAAGRNLRAVYRWMPCYHCDWLCIYPMQPDDPAPCVASVTIEDVWAAIEPALG
jgi:ADP-heptose:LPS heptosyltransferase